MTSTRKTFVPSLLLAAAALLATSANAAIVTYTDRAAFTAAASGLTVDTLSNITEGGFNQDRGAYSFDMQAYGCVNGPSSCGDNTDDGFSYPGYVWTYTSGTFVFDDAIDAFGLDFGFYGGASASVTLAGITHTVTNGGFLGFINTAGSFSSVSYAAQGSGSLFDNVSYGGAGTQSVPEPSSLALIGLALAGVGLSRRGKGAAS